MGQWIKKGIKEEIKFLELNEITTQQNLCNTLKVVPRGKFIAINKYTFKNSEIAETTDSIIQFKNLEKQDEIKCKLNRQEEIIKITEINEIDSKKTIQRTDKSKNLFFGKINKINRPLVQLNTTKRETTQINRIRDEWRSIKQAPKTSRRLSGTTLNTVLQTRKPKRTK